MSNATNTPKLSQIKNDVYGLFAVVHNLETVTTADIKTEYPKGYDLRTKAAWLEIAVDLDAKLDEKIDDTNVDAEPERINLTEKFPALVAEAGINSTLFCTPEFYRSMLEIPVAAEGMHNDANGVMWDILTMLRHGFKRSARTPLETEYMDPGGMFFTFNFTVIVTGSDLAPAYKSDQMPHYIVTTEHRWIGEGMAFVLTLQDQALAGMLQAA